MIRGCIPSKAIIHAAERFESLQQHASEEAIRGYSSLRARNDMAALVGWKDAIVERLNKGVEALLKGSKCTSQGLGDLYGPKKCTVETSMGLLKLRLKT